MFTGSVGASGKLTFGPAVADGSVPAEYMMGVATQDIENQAFGYITSFGLVRGFNTTGSLYGEVWADGDLLYFDPATPGAWTNVKPSPPSISVPVAVVINAGSGGSGSIFVRMELSKSLNSLQDVHINGGPSAGQVLIYDAAQQRWENHFLTPGLGISISNSDGAVTISSTGQQLKTQQEAPSSSGFSLLVNPIAAGLVANVWLLINPSSAFSTGTIVLPPVLTCVDRQLVSVSCTKQVSSLTVDGNGASVRGAPTSLGADAHFQLMFNLPTTTWHSI
jgi:hypothetical protein